MKIGVCKLCNTVGQLTYEHVPPKVIFNKRTRFRKINFLDYIKEPNPFTTKISGKIEQGGVGYYSLCRNCNHFLGITYVKDYQKYTHSLIEFAKKGHFNSFGFTMNDFNALPVLKQIVSMFFSINDVTFSKNNRDLAEFVLDPKSNDLPVRFKVFNYLNTEGQLRNIPLMALGNLDNEGIVLGTELAFPPLGNVLTIDFNGNLPYHQEITSFKNSKFGEPVTFDFKMYRLPTYLPLLLDYRDKAAIQKTIDESHLNS